MLTESILLAAALLPNPKGKIDTTCAEDVILEIQDGHWSDREALDMLRDVCIYGEDITKWINDRI